MAVLLARMSTGQKYRKGHRSETAALVTINYTDITTYHDPLTPQGEPVRRLNNVPLCWVTHAARRSFSSRVIDVVLGRFSYITSLCYMKKTIHEQSDTSVQKTGSNDATHAGSGEAS